MGADYNAVRRKSPVQQRSKQTVKRILHSATRILEERGYDGLSTNRIAAAAGISPGSLYQYFPNKDAILTAMVSEYSDQLVENIAIHLRRIMCNDTSNLVPAAVRATVRALSEQPEILRVISLHLPGQALANVLKPLETQIGQLIKGYAIALIDRPADLDVDAASWIMAQLLGVTVRYVVDEPPIAEEVFVNEMCRLAQGHPLAKACSPQL